MELSALHAVNPYHDFSWESYPDDRDGWHGYDPIFRELIEESRPRLIIEVGSWKGQSAITMANAVRELNLDCKIVCIDTWLGAGEFWNNQADPQRYLSLRLENGYPRVYYQFLSNVVRAGHKDRIIPFPQTSLIAGRWLAARNIRANLIYVDASHEQEDVSADLKTYAPLLTPGGILFGDDYDVSVWPGVAAAVDSFRHTGLSREQPPRPFWVFRSAK